MWIEFTDGVSASNLVDKQEKVERGSPGLQKFSFRRISPLPNPLHSSSLTHETYLLSE